MRRRRGYRTSRIFFGVFAVLIASFAMQAPSRRLARLPGGLIERTSEDKLVLPAAGHESADVGGRFIGAAVGLLLFSLAVVTLGVLWLFPLPHTDRSLNAPLPLYPEPRLQPSPRQDLQRLLAAEYEQLTTYGWVDKAHQIVRIPIDEAMKRIAQQGIPDWPASTPPESGQSAVARSSP